MNKGIITSIILLFCLALSGCDKENVSKISDSTAKPYAVVENLDVNNYFVKGKNKQVFDKAPERVLVVGETETETLIELGAAPNILMMVRQNSRPYKMKEENRQIFETLPYCKSMYLNKEYVTKLNPDLIVAQQCIFIRSRLNDTEYWNNKGIKTLIPLNTNSPSSHFYNETVEIEMKFIRDLGKAFQLEKNAERIIKETYDTIDDINRKTEKLDKPRVMIVEFMSSMVSYDRTKLVGNMVEKIGGRVAETPSVIGFENIIKEDPDVLFVVCSHADYGVCMNRITDNKALQNLQCIKNNRVYGIPLRLTYGSSCRTKDGILYLAERIYPDVAF